MACIVLNTANTTKYIAQHPKATSVPPGICNAGSLAVWCMYMPVPVNPSRYSKPVNSCVGPSQPLQKNKMLKLAARVANKTPIHDATSPIDSEGASAPVTRDNNVEYDTDTLCEPRTCQILSNGCCVDVTHAASDIQIS